MVAGPPRVRYKNIANYKRKMTDFVQFLLPFYLKIYSVLEVLDAANLFFSSGNPPPSKNRVQSIYAMLQ